MKKHFSDNKKLYFGIAIGGAIAGTGIYIWHLKTAVGSVVIDSPINAPSIIDSAGATIHKYYRGDRIHCYSDV